MSYDNIQAPPDPNDVITAALQADDPVEALHRASQWAYAVGALCRRCGWPAHAEMWRNFDYRMSGARQMHRALRGK